MHTEGTGPDLPNQPPTCAPLACPDGRASTHVRPRAGNGVIELPPRSASRCTASWNNSAPDTLPARCGAVTSARC
jgi:hypothetical protein